MKTIMDIYRSLAARQNRRESEEDRSWRQEKRERQNRIESEEAYRTLETKIMRRTLEARNQNAESIDQVAARIAGVLRGPKAIEGAAA